MYFIAQNALAKVVLLSPAAETVQSRQSRVGKKTQTKMHPAITEISAKMFHCHMTA